MRQVNVTELKNRLSRYLRLVKQGETLEVTERSVPIAILSRWSAGAPGSEGIGPLVRDGIVSPARLPADPHLVALDPVPCDADVAAALVEERGDR